ncbi:hypothetical protein OSTOST_22689, partial [Ostertagia ostertagi]
ASERLRRAVESLEQNNYDRILRADIWDVCRLSSTMKRSCGEAIKPAVVVSMCSSSEAQQTLAVAGDFGYGLGESLGSRCDVWPAETTVRGDQALSLELAQMYGTGDAGGYFGNDTVRFGGSGTKQLVDPISGILGLGFKELAVEGVNPPFQQAVDLGLVDKPIFTVFLEHKGEQSNVPGGVYTYGGLTQPICGPVIDYAPLISANYWQF